MGVSNENTKAMNLSITYPYSDDFEYQTYLERINFEEERANDIKMGKGFIISEPLGIKKDVKLQNGIFSSRYGSNSMSDVDSFNGVFRCNCGLRHGAIESGEYCDNCNSIVRYIGDDISITGYLLLNDKYWIIHPNIYWTIAAFIGEVRLKHIIEAKVDVDIDGKIKEVKPDPKKKDEPFMGIGILDFKDRFIEIMDFYLGKYPQKKVYYDDIMNLYNEGKVFTHTISVYSSLLRPSSLDDGSLKYEECNEHFNMLASLVYKCNYDKLYIYTKPKNKLTLLFDIQTKLNELYIEIKEILARKKGDIRSALGGRFSFSERSVIRQDVSLQADQVMLPFHGLVELLQQVIINILHKTYNMTYAEAYKKWYKAQITGKDQAIYDIIDGLIKDSDGGLPVFINRNPTIQLGGVLKCKVVGINMNYTMSVSLLILKLLGADFDGDTLNILFLYNKDIIERANPVFNPKMMYISRNDGRCNSDMLFTRDIIINANAMKMLCSYTKEQIDRIKMLQSID